MHAVSVRYNIISGDRAFSTKRINSLHFLNGSTQQQYLFLPVWVATRSYRPLCIPRTAYHIQCAGKSSFKEILCVDNTILWISKLCSCASVRWCFIELVWRLKGKIFNVLVREIRISPQDFRVLRPSISLPLHSSKPIEPNCYCFFSCFELLEYIIEHYLLHDAMAPTL